MSCLKAVIFSYLFYGDSMTFKALFHVYVLLSVVAYYFLNSFACWSLVIFLLFLQMKTDSLPIEKVIYILL